MPQQRDKKKRVRAKKDEVVPRGNLFMPGVSTAALTAALFATKDDAEKLKLQAAIQRRGGEDIREIARGQGNPYQTVRHRLRRMHEGGLARVKDLPRGGSIGKFGPRVLAILLTWLTDSPTRYGYEIGSWQLVIILDMLRRTFNIECGDRNLQLILNKIGASYSKARPVPAKSAPADVREKFKAKANATVTKNAEAGHAIMFMDEAHVQLEQDPGYAWRLAGGNDEAKTSFSRRSVPVFGALGADGYHIRTAKACNAEEFIKFLKEVNKMCPKMTIILDNASYHKAKAVRKFVDDANGDIELIFLPAYTPQLNPIEIQWRVLKRLLHGRYFATIEELEAAIMSLVDKCQMRPVKIMKYAIPA